MTLDLTQVPIQRARPHHPIRDGIVEFQGPAAFVRNTTYQRAYLAAEKAHEGQLRKCGTRAYFEHPREVAQFLVDHGERDALTLASALLHDVIEEPCGWTLERIGEEFGWTVRCIVEELTDTPGPKAYRHAAQVRHAPSYSGQAARIKVADKVCNMRDMAARAPKGYTIAQRLDYLLRAAAVVGAMGANLDMRYRAAFVAEMEAARLLIIGS